MKLNEFIFSDESKIDKKNYFIVTYKLASKIDIATAAFDLAVGQSIGNPSVRNEFESDRLVKDHCCIILGDEKELKKVKTAIVKIAFPISNIDIANDGISQILCFIQGGQLDINRIDLCQILDIEFSEEYTQKFHKPAFGLSGIRKKQNYFDKPLFGGILKPKVGLDEKTYQKLVESLVLNGTNFIKEDEIMSNPSILPLKKRIQITQNILKGHQTIFAYCINGDPHCLEERLKLVRDNGGNGVHLNFWSGFGAYNSIKKWTPELFVHYQKSGVSCITDPRNPFSISWQVILRLAILCGVDSVHIGMIGGYSSDKDSDVKENVNLMIKHNTISSISCGFNPGLVERVTKELGNDYMASVGGAIYGHPMGAVAGVKAMRQAIDKNYQVEYLESLKVWPKVG